MKQATVKEIDFDRQKEYMIIICDIRGSMFIDSGKYSKTLLNSAPILEGVNYLLKYGHEAVNAFKGNKEFQTLAKENEELKGKLALFASFQNGEKVKIKGFTFQKGINEASFADAFKKLILKA